MTNIKQKKMKINQIFINIKYYERDKEFIIYKISIHSKKMSEDKLKKIVQKYKSKYKLNLPEFNQFLVRKVEVDSFQSGHIIDYIRQENPDIYQFSEDSLIFFLNIIAAVQKGCNINKVDKQEIKQYQKIKFAGGNKKTKSRIEQQIKEPQLQKNKFSQKSRSNKSEKIEQSQKNRIEEKNFHQKQQEKKNKYEQFDDNEEQHTGYFGVKSQKIEKEVKEEKKEKEEKNILKLGTITEQNTDDLRIKQSSEYQFKLEEQSQNKSPTFYVEADTNYKVVIDKYDKTGQDLINPVIKYQIRYKQKFLTWRRYSEIQKFMTFLKRKYEGIALPEMPPKQGIKGGITQLWSGVDEIFLTERKQRLQDMFNRLLDSKYVNEDEDLIRFLQNQDFQIQQNPDDEYSYMKMFSGLTDIVFNAKQIKDYGIAYYNYVSQYKNKPINSQIAKEYEELQEILNLLKQTNSHRRKINENFDKRRQIMYFLYEKKANTLINQPIKTEFDKKLEKAVTESNELTAQYNKYVQLKSSQSWLGYLKKQKNDQMGTKSLQNLQEDENRIKLRIEMMEKNLHKSIQEFKSSKSSMIKILFEKMIEWRTQIHP